MPCQLPDNVRPPVIALISYPPSFVPSAATAEASASTAPALAGNPFDSEESDGFAGDDDSFYEAEEGIYSEIEPRRYTFCYVVCSSVARSL